MVKFLSIILILLLFLSFFLWQKLEEFQRINSELSKENKTLQRLMKTIEQSYADTNEETNQNSKNKYQRLLKKLLEEPPQQHSDRSDTESIGDLYQKQIPNLIPVKGKYELSQFYSDEHKGLDFAASTGTPIVAAALGVVINVYEDTYFGNVIEIDHLNGYKTRYAHLQKILVNKEQLVNQNEIIGTIGNTGNSSAPHLHLEIIKKGVFINPITVLKHVKK